MRPAQGESAMPYRAFLESREPSMPAQENQPTGRRDGARTPRGHDSAAARLIGRSRMIVLVAVLAVMLAAFSLFLLGAVLAGKNIWNAWAGVMGGQLGSTDLTLQFLEIVIVMLKAVFFYLIGVGLYSLFISPLNLTVALGVETLNDLETKIISIIVVIMAVNFLEHFIQWRDAVEILYSAGALALSVSALVFFKIFAHRETQESRQGRESAMGQAKVEMFERDHEQHDVVRTVKD